MSKNWREYSRRVNYELYQSEFSVLSGRVIMELSRIYCQILLLTITINQSNLSHNFIWLQNYTPTNFIENVPLGTKGTKFKKILGRIFFWKMQCQKNPYFLLHQMLSLLSITNLVYVLGIKILGADYPNLNNLFQRY